MTKQESYGAFELRVQRRAKELLAGMPPEFNAAPTIECVRHAYSLGYDLVRADEPACEHEPAKVISGRLDATGEHYTYLCTHCGQQYDKHIAPL